MSLKDFNINSIVSYTINLLLGIIGFFLVSSYNKTNETLAQINRDVLDLQKEIVELRLEMTSINLRMMSDDRVRELIRLELSK